MRNVATMEIIMVQRWQDRDWHTRRLEQFDHHVHICLGSARYHSRTHVRRHDVAVSGLQPGVHIPANYRDSNNVIIDTFGYSLHLFSHIFVPCVSCFAPLFQRVRVKKQNDIFKQNYKQPVAWNVTTLLQSQFWWKQSKDQTFDICYKYPLIQILIQTRICT